MNTIDIDNITLTGDQEEALLALSSFLVDPVETVFVLRGFSGCGKSTLVRTFLDRMHSYQRAAKLINPAYQEYLPELTATTNKAAENLSQITGMTAGTIQSFLGLRVEVDYRANTSKLIPRANFTPPSHQLVFIDEASYIDHELLAHVFTRTVMCKIIFIGDPAQLTPVKSNSTPVFSGKYRGAALTTVVRQAEGNPIVDLSTKFRHTVTTGEWLPFAPDGHHVRRLNRADFREAMELEFTRPDWRYQDSKVLAWTNKCVISYNEMIRGMAKGDPNFQVDDYAVCNSYYQKGRSSIKTDQLVHITGISDPLELHGVMGNTMTLDHSIQAFQPKSLEAARKRMSAARAAQDFETVAEIEGGWIDLRGAYAQTVNKAQGSTYGSVYIDLDDISKCNSGDQIARMLYVAVSRARNHVYLTGDLA